ncbi:Ubiquitin-conjugating enzyme E2 [Penicillium cosmopolitanum]|uniref:Ubiquitin-conjugating enzyme E2 n=1 Tax=Penicillium cosmopolitanum TaxID=1131564 RepID=A0A9X0B8I5_9EURO|nr:Ubiquitin-conjugating enzyme E2 [Penicillium cosmopolitanum]KAJ5392077.1 Ubiquitin-conjugating enzyme E2 [Penicillium cosmopolitanum]
MPSNLRRLAADHAALHNELPPYYMLSPDDGHVADDLSQLTILLAGPAGTPYSQGLWRLHLKMPADYPKSPPKAAFRTKIWHPNVEENTGAVCVDTLKRDWQSKLTLRDVLVTISCLLINPNPDSALNSSAGNLLREDFQTFAHQAKLMTSIHAPIPPNFATAVREAKYRGEDPDSISEAEKKEQKETTVHPRLRKQPRLNTEMTMKPTRRAPTAPPTNQQPTAPALAPPPPPQDENMSDSENEDPASASKENNPSLSPTPIRQNLTPPSPRKALGKRPLSVLSIPYPDDQDTEMMIIDTDDDQDQHNHHSSNSEQNITANNNHTHHPNTRSRSRSPRKSPKRIFLGKQALSPTTTPQTIPPFRLRDDMQIYEDVPDRTLSDFSSRFGTAGPGMSRSVQEVPSPHRGHGGTAPLSNPNTASAMHPISALTAPIQSKVMKKVPSGPRKGVQKAKPRIGVRRL